MTRSRRRKTSFIKRELPMIELKSCLSGTSGRLESRSWRTLASSAYCFSTLPLSWSFSRSISSRERLSSSCLRWFSSKRRALSISLGAGHLDHRVHDQLEELLQVVLGVDELVDLHHAVEIVEVAQQTVVERLAVVLFVELLECLPRLLERLGAALRDDRREHDAEVLDRQRLVAGR